MSKISEAIKQPISIHEKTCTTAKVLSVGMLVIGFITCVMMIISGKSIIHGVAVMMMSSALSIKLLLTYDILCKQGYELSAILFNVIYIIGLILLAFK